MTRIVIVGEMFYSDLSVGGGPMPPGAGQQPPGYWGGVAPPYVDIGGPGSQPHPSHPIAPGGRPPGYWGGVAPPHPDHGLPGQPPGYWGGVAPPTVGNPIAPGGPPPGIWGGPPNYVDIGLPSPPPQPWVPPEGETIPPPPDEIVNQVVVAVWNPTAQAWKVTVGG